jgi:hypothetical protein
MDPMTVRQKRFTWATFLICTAALVVVLIPQRWPLQLEYWRWRAARECRSEGEFPPPHLVRLLGAGEEAFPYLLRLLKDPDEGVSWRFRVGMDSMGMNRSEIEVKFLAYLRRTDRMAALSYIFPPRNGAAWAAGLFNSGPDWYAYWSGENGIPLEPFTEGVDFLESIIFGLRVFENAHSLNARAYAVDALAAMLRPGEVRAPQSPVAARVVELLARAAREGDPEERLHALNRMVIRSEQEEAWKSDPKEIRIVNGNIEYFPLPSFEELKSRGFRSYRKGSLLALCHLDHPEAAPILSRLMMKTNVGALLAKRPRLGPLEMPPWVIVEVDGKLEVRLDPHG